MKVLTLLIAMLLLSASLAHADETDPRYCGPPARYADGRIIRSAAEVAKFKRIHPCPVTGLATGRCDDWAVDHTIPLACGGCDVISNMTWLPNAIKSGPGTLPKDRWERAVYCYPRKVTP
jgi:hypothetical protein